MLYLRAHVWYIEHNLMGIPFHSNRKKFFEFFGNAGERDRNQQITFKCSLDTLTLCSWLT